MADDILSSILATKRDEVSRLRARTGRASLLARAREASPLRGFVAALAKSATNGPAVIAEIKKASPSKGLIRADFDPPVHARQYAAGGAAALSVLTDRDYFQGDDSYLVAARAACSLPVLRKDFVIDELQVVEARAIGADAILLIVAALAVSQLEELAHAAAEQDLDILLEVHDRAELDQAQRARFPTTTKILLGVNNRNLKTFVTRLETTFELFPHAPAGWSVVAESGLSTADDIARLRQGGIERFLIGESLMRQPDPGAGPGRADRPAKLI